MVTYPLSRSSILKRYFLYQIRASIFRDLACYLVDFGSESHSHQDVENYFVLLLCSEQHLKAIGIEKRGHRKRLLMEIEKLPQMDIPQEVPVIINSITPALSLTTE